MTTETVREGAPAGEDSLAARPWLAQYPRGVPATIDYPEITLPQFFADAVGRFADLPAVIYFGRTFTYRELDRLSAQFANRLRQFGLQKGDRVLVMLPNLPQFMIAHFGILRAGGVVAAISPLLVEREEKNVLVVVIAGDKGFAGGFNSNIGKAAQRFIDERRAAA